MITARVSLDDVVEQGFEALVKHKDLHSKIIATPRADLLPRKRRQTNEMEK
jgi:(R,R)-butanediol dehydrogenase/meso-butanediol dehydrogenase/diacetyl reductase